MKVNRILTFFFVLIVTPYILGRCPRVLAKQDTSIEGEVDTYVKPYIDMGCFSGCILVVREGNILLKKGYGMANVELGVANGPETVFHIASVSKPFTAAAILILQERGLLSVNDPLTVYIPDYPGGDKITLHHLMTHTSGIPNVNDFPDYDAKSKFSHTTSDLVALFKDKPTMFEPGERYSYSNSNYNLLAYIIEHVSGMSYGEFLQKNVFGPLNMESTAHHGHAGTLIMNRASGYVPVGIEGFKNAPFIDWSIKTGNGSLYSTVDDLYAFDRALYTQKLLKKSSLEQALTEHIEGVGYGWFIGKRHGRNVIRINGRSPGFGSAFQRYVDDDVCIVVLSNNYAATASAIADGAAAIVFGELYEIPNIIEPVSLSPQQMERFTGWYQFGDTFYVPNARYRMESRGDYLLMRLGDWSTSLVPQSDATFFIREFWATVSFVKNAGGDVSHLLWGDFKALKVDDED